MIKSNSWNWNNIEDNFWQEPADDIYYILYRWKKEGYSQILDLGCGIGRHSILFSENGFSVTGYDLSESGLNKLNLYAKDKGLQIKTVLGDIKYLPFGNEYFDCIIAYHSMYHTDTPGMECVIKEIERVMKKNGEIYASFISKNTYSYSAPECKKVDENVRLKKEEDGNILPHYFVDYKDIKLLLSNFEIIKVKQVEDLWDGKSSWHYFVHAKNI